MAVTPAARRRRQARSGWRAGPDTVLARPGANPGVAVRERRRSWALRAVARAVAASTRKRKRDDAPARRLLVVQFSGAEEPGRVLPPGRQPTRSPYVRAGAARAANARVAHRAAPERPRPASGRRSRGRPDDSGRQVAAQRAGGQRGLRRKAATPAGRDAALPARHKGRIRPVAHPQLSATERDRGARIGGGRLRLRDVHRLRVR
jgi:hypothetical protein